MRFLYILLIVFISLLTWTCQNIEDASPTKRKTFFRLYEPPYNLTATDFEITNDGYVILGNMSVPPAGSAVDSIVTVVFRVDKSGNRLSEFTYYLGGIGESIKRHPDGGYIIVGESIKRNLNPDFVANGIKSSARILVIDDNFVLKTTLIEKDPAVNPEIPMDIYATGLTIHPDTKDILVLGTFIPGVQNQLTEPERPVLINYSYSGNDFSLTETWRQEYDLVERNYKNTRSVHFVDNTIIWASSIARTVVDVTFSYITIPYVQENSQFLNSSSLGETTEQLFEVNDIQPAKFNGFGYGIIGTYSETTDRKKANILFMRVAPNGNLIEGSERYFDAVLSEDNTSLTDPTQSTEDLEDEGLALAATTDGGFVLAGSMTTVPIKGNGGKDIYLIKVNAIGDVVWSKTFGGAGDEVVTRIKEGEDGTLVILGTTTIGGASSAFLIKTDRNGELKN
jgi:hypothetical protein